MGEPLYFGRIPESATADLQFVSRGPTRLCKGEDCPTYNLYTVETDGQYFDKHKCEAEGSSVRCGLETIAVRELVELLPADIDDALIALRVAEGRPYDPADSLPEDYSSVEPDEFEGATHAS